MSCSIELTLAPRARDSDRASALDYVSSEDNGGEDDSNAIGLYNMSQNYCLDLSDDVGDSMKREDILATTGFTVPSVGLRTKTATPQDELESHKKAMQSRQLDAQRIDQKISPFMTRWPRVTMRPTWEKFAE